MSNSTLSFDANMIELGTTNSLVRVNGSLVITGDTRIADRATADALSAHMNLQTQTCNLRISEDVNISYEPDSRILSIDAEHVHFPGSKLTAGPSVENLLETIEYLKAQIAVLNEMMTEIYNAPGMPGYVKSMINFYDSASSSSIHDNGDNGSLST